jgi:hypothetical protein
VEIIKAFSIKIRLFNTLKLRSFIFFFIYDLLNSYEIDEIKTFTENKFNIMFLVEISVRMISLVHAFVQHLFNKAIIYLFNRTIKELRDINSKFAFFRKDTDLRLPLVQNS